MESYHAQRDYLSGLALSLKEQSQTTENGRKRRHWAQHNDLLSKSHPPFWVCPDDDGVWMELIPQEELRCVDPELRLLERKLQQYLYQAKHFKDDMVFEPCVYWETPGEYTGYHYGNFSQTSVWGLPIVKQQAGWRALKMEEVIKTRDDFELLMRHEVDFIEDKDEQTRLSEKLSEAVAGQIDIRFQLPYSVLVQALMIDLVHLRGLENLLLDLYDAPELLDASLQHMASSKERLLLKLERERKLFDNRINIYTGSGSLGYTTLPRKKDEDVRLKDMWGFADTQEFSHVSPEMFERFAISNQVLGLRHFGMVCYGCCEPLDKTYDLIYKHVPNLRRLSVSPWSDLELAAEKIGTKAIFSWKPNPALVKKNMNENAVKMLLEKVKHVAKDCYLEIILKDLRTCGGKEPLLRFIDLVNEVFERK